jgi:hypothetical protein
MKFKSGIISLSGDENKLRNIADERSRFGYRHQFIFFAR